MPLAAPAKPARSVLDRAEHSACTFARSGFDATLPYGARVTIEHGS